MKMGEPSLRGASRSIVVVGGGFSGATFAVQLLRKTTVPVAITIVEPREEVGRGLAYSATDPDHRLNSALPPHAIDPEHPEEIARWVEESGALERDPECVLPSGEIFLRRSELGRYLAEQVRIHASERRLGSTLQHVREVAVDAQRWGDGFRVSTGRGALLHADFLVVCTGNPVPSLRPPFAPEHAEDLRIIANPLEPNCLDRIGADDRVLIVGGGLTALDVVSTLLRRSHRSDLLVVSRRGLRPREQTHDILAPHPAAAKTGRPLDMIYAPVPDFIAEVPPTARAWCRALRQQLAKVEAQGLTWHDAFDPVRNVVWKLWPQLPIHEKKRFLHRLRIFYDVHRFRTPPMNDAMARAAEKQQQVRYAAAKLTAVDTSRQGRGVVVELTPPGGEPAYSREFDFVVNCTGLDSTTSWKSNPFLRRLHEHGLLQVHPTGMGFNVASDCTAIDTAGDRVPGLKLIGIPTAGVFGDPLGLLFIAGQVHRILPAFVSELADVAQVEPQGAD
jgi:uncharacterized NAD(P)/FAD-binding protein YdhS